MGTATLTIECVQLTQQDFNILLGHHGMGRHVDANWHKPPTHYGLDNSR